MSFRYLNPGLISLVAENDNAAQTFDAEKIYSKTTLAFSQTDSSKALCYQNLLADAYIKFDFYRNGGNSSGNFCIKITNANEYGFYFGKNGICLANNSGTKSDYYSVNNGINKVWGHFHLTGDKATSYIEFKINDSETITREFSSDSWYGTAFYDNQATKFLLYASAAILFSNIIISDEYIDPKEQIIQLPISSTQTDMAFDTETGIYTATAANQSLLSAVNVNALIEEYGSDSAVTGIALVGNPAYKTAEGLSSLTAISANNSNIITEHGTYNLSDDTTAAIIDGQILTNTTISDLQGRKFGWKAG